MPRRTWKEWVVLAIGAITVLSGAVQIVLPSMTLRTLGVTADPAVVLLFRLTSALTLLFGVGLVHAVLGKRSRSPMVLWAGLAKLAGPTIIVAGFLEQIVSPVALGVAGYDALTGLFVLWFWLVVREE